MKKKMITWILSSIMLMSVMTGCRSTEGTASSTGSAEEVTQEASDVGAEAETETNTESEAIMPEYVTVTEAFDWGPAITKVILSMGVEIDPASIDNETFQVSSERKYTGMNFETFEAEEVDSIEERNITQISVTNEAGEVSENGSYITIQMEVGPSLVAGSPFNYDMSTMKNVYVDTSYLISVNEGKIIKDAQGNELAVEEIAGEASVGNLNLIGDQFDVTGTYSYTEEEKKIDLTYASFLPDANAPEASTPLIIWLHGVGEGGTNPMISIMGNKVVNLATEEIQQLFGETGAQILAPQCPTMWMDVDGTSLYNTDPSQIEVCDGTSYYTQALKGLIDDYLSNHPEIDTNRIYIGGCSNGGYMTVNMLVNYSDFFAAAYPVCEAYSVKWLSDEKIANLKNIPIWLTAAKTDGTVAVFQGTTGEDYVTYNLDMDESGEAIPLDDFSNALYNRLVEAKAADVHYSLFDNVVDTSGNYLSQDGSAPYEYMGHWSWIYTLNNECVETIDQEEITIFEWLANQSNE